MSTVWDGEFADLTTKEAGRIGCHCANPLLMYQNEDNKRSHRNCWLCTSLLVACFSTCKTFGYYFDHVSSSHEPALTSFSLRYQMLPTCRLCEGDVWYPSLIRTRFPRIQPRVQLWLLHKEIWCWSGISSCNAEYLNNGSDGMAS